MLFKGILDLIVDRPLVFLCGCAVDSNNIKRDRREILRKAINKNWHSDRINPIPLIVDNFFRQELIEKYSLKVNLLEEIVANISYCTYIFLDTMSTSYELGQFTNYSYSHNKVRVLVDNEYEKRNNCSIGGYISLSFNDKFIKYDAKYDPKGHISFSKKALPSKLKDLIKKDNPINNNFEELIPISFSNENIKLVNGLFKYKRYGNSLVFTCNIFTLFYFVSGVYYLHRKTFATDEANDKTINSPWFKDFKNILLKEIYKSFLFKSEPDERRVLFDDVEPTLFIESSNVDELIYHCLSLSFLLPSYESRYKYLLVKDYQKIDIGSVLSTPLSGYISSYDYIIQKNKMFDREKLPIVTKSYLIRGKRRTISTYKNDYYGHSLRLLHKHILKNVLSLLPTSENSFAYKTSMNCLKCVKKHFGNTYFIKMDISKYFNSIKYSNLIRMISTYFEDKINSVFHYPFSKQFVREDIKKITATLFKNYKTPIGFICSPKISDFYLFEMDKQIGSLDGVIYTRYADDILISSTSKERVVNASILIEEYLNKTGLKINQEKCIIKALKNNNDSIKFLNINIIKRTSDCYEVSISRKYLEKTVKLIASNKKSYTNIISGRAVYIRSISKKSYEIFLRMVKARVGLDRFHFEYKYKLR